MGLLGQVAGRLEADDGVGAEQRGQHERAEPGVVADGRHRAGRGEVRPVPQRPDRGHDQQEHGQPDDADDLGGHRGVVHPGGEPGRGDDQRRLQGQHHQGLERGAGRCVRLPDQRLEGHLDQAVVDRDGDDGQERERHPAEPPADMRVGQPGGPLVGVAGQRDPDRERAVDQRDQRLAGDHDGPGPDGPRPAGGQRERVGGEDAGGDRDERERHRERLEVAQRADELLAVAEPAEFVVLRDASLRDLIHVVAPYGACRRVQPAAVSGWVASALASGSVRTAVMASSGQTRCTAIVPSLLESART